MSDILVTALTTQELYHHGIEGMHWGERRYQNYDGSLTEEGHKRYGVKAAKKNIRQLEENLAYAQYNKKRAEKDLDKITGRGTIFSKNPTELSDRGKRMYDKQLFVYMNALTDLSSKMDDYVNAVNEAKSEYGNKKIKDIKYDKNGNIKASLKGENALKAAGITTFLLASVPIGVVMEAYPEAKKSSNYKKLKKQYQTMYDDAGDLWQG